MTSIVALIFWIALQQPTSATISGITRRFDNGQPLAGATVTLTSVRSAPAPAAPGALPIGPRATPIVPPINLQTRSDELGRFVFSGVPVGPYTISAVREGFNRSQTRSASGQTAPSVLTVSAGRDIGGLVLTLAPKAYPSISGVVYGADGKRLAAANVQAYRVRYTPLGRQFVRVASVLSHEGGEYRLFDLIQGMYVVSASYSEQTIQPWKSRVGLTPNLPNPDEGYAPVYFPGSPTVLEARTLKLSDTGESTGIDIRFKEVDYFRLIVHLLPPVTGRSLKNARVAMYPLGLDIGAAVDYHVKSNGTAFSIDHVARGDYVVVALDSFLDREGNTITRTVSNPQVVHLTENTEVSIGTADPFNVAGIVRAPGGVVPKGLKVQLIRTDRSAVQTVTADVIEIPFTGEGQFELQDVEAGAYDVRLSGIPNTSYLGDAGFPRDPERELAKIHIDVAAPDRVFEKGVWKSAEIFNVELNLNGETANGVVLSKLKHEPAPGMPVVLVPTDLIARLRTDRYFFTFSGTAGVFQIRGVPPGNYHAYSILGIDSGIYFNPEFDRQIAPLAVTYRGGLDLITLIDIPADAIASLTP